MYKTRIKEKWWFSQCGRTWLVCRKPAEHLWCDFKCRPWAKNSSPNTNDLYIHFMDKSTGTPPSLEDKKALPNCGNKDGSITHVLKMCISTSVPTVLKCMKLLYHMYKSLVFGDEFLAQGLHLKSHQRCSAGFLQTSQVLPHWLNHHFSLILVLYTEALSS